MRAVSIVLWGAVVLVVLPVAGYLAVATVVGRDRVWQTLFGPDDRGAVDFATLGPPARPNRWLMCPPGHCPGADAESPVFDVAAERLHAAAVALLEQDGAIILEAGGDRIEAEVRTPLLRFPDRITIDVLPAGPGRSTLAVLSRSVYGRGDLGTNRKRVDAWIEALRRSL